MAFCVYMLECRDKSLYCGYTIDIRARVKAHNSGVASKYTMARRPVKLVYTEKKKSKSAAMKREAEIKKMTRRQKQGLVAARLKAPFFAIA